MCAFLQRHATAPVLQDFCKQFLRTVLLLCWFHVKQAWNEACKTKVSPRSQWPEMYGMLSATMQLKTWSAACKATGENVCCQPDDHELWYAEVAQADILITVPPSS